jgi:polar amino acid transport system substrate-binding protein
MFKKIFCMMGLLVLFSLPALAKDPLKFVYTNYAPANYQTETGEFKGFFVDIVIEAFKKRMGIPVEIAIFPWKRCQAMVEAGEADMILTIPTPERAVYTITHEKPFWIKKWRLYTYTGHPAIDKFNTFKGLEDLKTGGYTVVSYLGNGWTKTMVEDAGIPCVNANTVEGMYKMLAEKRGDVLIEDTILVNPSLKSLQLADKIIATEGVVAESNYHMLIGKKSQYAEIVPQLNKTIEDMWKDGTIEKILTEYIGQ